MPIAPLEDLDSGTSTTLLLEFDYISDKKHDLYDVNSYVTVIVIMRQSVDVRHFDVNKYNVTKCR